MGHFNSSYNQKPGTIVCSWPQAGIREGNGNRTLSLHLFIASLWNQFYSLLCRSSQSNVLRMNSDDVSSPSVQFSSVAQWCPTLCDPMNRSTPGLPVHHHLPEFTQTHVHRVSDVIQPSHPLSSPSAPAPNPSQHQSFPMSQLFAWGGQSTGVSALASFLPKNTQD